MTAGMFRTLQTAKVDPHPRVNVNLKGHAHDSACLHCNYPFPDMFSIDSETSGSCSLPCFSSFFDHLCVGTPLADDHVHNRERVPLTLNLVVMGS